MMPRFSVGLLTACLCLSTLHSLPGNASTLANEPPVLTEPLQQPALHSALASRALMLDVTTAGNALVAVGERGFIVRSEDNGDTWQQMPAPVSVTLTRVTFPSAEHGWAVGHAGVILHSGDGGRSWHLQLDGRAAAVQMQQAAEQALATAPGAAAERRLNEARNQVADGPDKPFLAVHFFDTRRGLVVGAYGLAFATEDGGAHWQSIDTQLENPGALHLYAIEALGEQVFIAGEQGLLLRSQDGGASFQALDSPASGTLFGLVAAGPRRLLAFGLRGKLYLSDDAGDSWQGIANPQSITLTAGTRLSDGRLVLADESGRLLTSTDPLHGFTATSLDEPAYLTGLTELADGQVAVSSARGLSRQGLDPHTIDALTRSTPREQ